MSVLVVPNYWPVSHVHEGEGAVQAGQQDVCQAEVEDKVVGDTPHSPVSWNNFFLSSFFFSIELTLLGPEDFCSISHQ